MELLAQHLSKGLILTLMISLPCILTAAGVGLIIGILQAVTQVQEQTIAAAPKIILVFSIIILGGGLMMTMLENYVRESTQLAFEQVPKDGVMLMPPLTDDERHARMKAFFANRARGLPSKRLNASSGRSLSESGSSEGSSLQGQFNRSRQGLGLSETMVLNKNQ